MSDGEPLRAQEVEVQVSGGRRILGPVSIEAAPGRLTAVLGPSGSGKSTLLRVLAGLTDPTGGTARLGEDPVAARIDQLGYVPQRETVHDWLTVEEALEYAARLRLGPGPEADYSVEQVLEELDLRGRRHSFIRDLSGGERRRTACGLELVGDLRVLLLDEPTSGLDPVLERRLMLMFRRLADRGRSVVVATHTSASLDVCDSVLVLEPGGTAAFAGSPAGAQEHLEAVVREGEAREAADHASRSARARRDVREPSAARRRFSLEFRTLVARYRRTLLRDRRTLAALVVQAPIIGLLISIPFRTSSLFGSGAAPAQLEQVVFLLMTAAIWLGITSAAQEVVKERGIIEREFDVGLRLDAYVLAKATVLFALVIVQVLLVDLVVFALRLHGVGAGGLLQLFALGVVVGWVSVSLGLAVSAIVRTAAQATGVVPLLLIPQLLFAGALIPLAQMPRLVQGLADITFARWAFAAMGGAAGLQSSLGTAGDAASALGVDPRFFALTPGAGLAILAVFAFILLLLASLVLGRRVLDPMIVVKLEYDLAVNATRLLVLGAVKILQPAHGYQVRRELISWRVEGRANVKPGSIYGALRTLERDGAIAVHSRESGERRPDRTTYVITTEGEKEFQLLLREAWWTVSPPIEPLIPALTLMPFLPREELIRALQARIGALEAQLESMGFMRGTIKDGATGAEGEIPEHVKEILDFIGARDRGELEWSRELQRRLKDGAYPKMDSQP